MLARICGAWSSSDQKDSFTTSNMLYSDRSCLGRLKIDHVLGGLDFIANLSPHPFDPLSARGPRLEGIAEVLGLTGNLPVSELHDTHRVRRQAVEGLPQNPLSTPSVDL